jgi:hypothetical protein
MASVEKALRVVVPVPAAAGLVGPGGGAAIDAEGHAGDVACAVAEEPGGSLRDLLRLSDPSEGGE